MTRRRLVRCVKSRPGGHALGRGATLRPIGRGAQAKLRARCAACCTPQGRSRIGLLRPEEQGKDPGSGSTWTQSWCSTRAAKMTPERRREIAEKAASSHWKKDRD